MVDRGGLENRCGFAPTVGSNPTLSANILKYLKRLKKTVASGPSRITLMHLLLYMKRYPADAGLTGPGSSFGKLNSGGICEA